jgi:hypothetical protein
MSKTANPIGRPTLYRPEIIDEINEYLKEAVPENMDIPTVEGIALKLGISKDTLYEWAKIHPEFSDALGRLKMEQKQHLIKAGIFGGKEVNATIIALLLKVNHDMIETTKQDITTGGDKITFEWNENKDTLHTTGSSNDSTQQPD